MKKRFLPALLALAMVLALLPVSAFAAPEDDPGAPAAQANEGATGNTNYYGATDYYYYAPAADTLSVNLVKLVADMDFPQATTEDTTVTLTTKWTDNAGQEVSGKTVAGTTYKFAITVAAAENYSLRESYTAAVTNYPDAVLSNNVISGTAAVEAASVDSGAVAAAVKTAMGDACAAALDSTLFESGYTAKTGEAAAADNADFKVAVAVKGLRRHENSGTMGYWVGVNFPKTVTSGEAAWTLTTYKRDGQTAKTLGEGDFTGDVLADYYNVADAGEGVENAAMRKVELTYSQESAAAAVTVLVDLTGVQIVLPPAPEAGSDGQLTEDDQNTLKDAIAAAGNTASTDPYAEAPDTIQVPVVSVDFSAAAEAGNAGTIPAGVVESLKTVNSDAETNNVGLKIKGSGGAEATLDPKAIGKLSGSALSATVKAEAVTADKANAITDTAARTKVAELLTRYAGNGVKAVTVDMRQGGASPFAAADAAIAITVKIPVPDNTYTAVLHISASGVTKHTGLTVKTEGASGFYVELKVTHLSDLIPAKPADLDGIAEENTPAAGALTAKNVRSDIQGFAAVKVTGMDAGKYYLIRIAKTYAGDANNTMLIVTGRTECTFNCTNGKKVAVLEFANAGALSGGSLTPSKDVRVTASTTPDA